MFCSAAEKTHTSLRLQPCFSAATGTQVSNLRWNEIIKMWLFAAQSASAAAPERPVRTFNPTKASLPRCVGERAVYIEL